MYYKIISKSDFAVANSLVFTLKHVKCHTKLFINSVNSIQAINSSKFNKFKKYYVIGKRSARPPLISQYFNYITLRRKALNNICYNIQCTKNYSLFPSCFMAWNS